MPYKGPLNLETEVSTEQEQTAYLKPRSVAGWLGGFPKPMENALYH